MKALKTLLSIFDNKNFQLLNNNSSNLLINFSDSNIVAHLYLDINSDIASLREIYPDHIGARFFALEGLFNGIINGTIFHMKPLGIRNPARVIFPSQQPAT